MRARNVDNPQHRSKMNTQNHRLIKSLKDDGFRTQMSSKGEFKGYIFVACLGYLNKGYESILPPRT